MMGERTVNELNMEEKYPSVTIGARGNDFFVWSRIRQRWCRVIEVGIVPNHRDIKMGTFYSDDKKYIKILGKDKEWEKKPDTILNPKGDVCILTLEEGISLFLDSGIDPGNRIFEMMKVFAQYFPIKKGKRKLTSLKGIFGEDKPIGGRAKNRNLSEFGRDKSEKKG